MEVFKPQRWLGLASGVALLLLTLALDGAILWEINRTGISVVSFVLALVLIVSVFVLILLVYWLYGLLWSGFHLDLIIL